MIEPLVDFVVANEYELCSSASVADSEEAARAFLGAVVVKRGPAGATLVTREGSVSVPAIAIEARGMWGRETHRSRCRF